jgi:hypothetical protein
MAIEDWPNHGTFPQERRAAGLARTSGGLASLKHAIAQAEGGHSLGQDRVEIPVTVEYEARIDIWNPGGIGQYSVKITPHG